MAKIASKIVGDGFVRFEFADGEFLQCTLDKIVSADVMGRLALHGISQKVGDSYAGAESVKEARLLAEGVWRNLVSGLWVVKATRGGKIVEALHRVTGQPIDVCLDKFAGMDEAAKKNLRKHPAIKKALAEIEAERAAAVAEAAANSGEDVPDLGDLFE